MSSDLTPIPLTRAQIAQSITGDPRSVRAVEALFQQAYQDLPAGAVLTWETTSTFAAGRVASGSPGLGIDLSTPDQAKFAVLPNALPVAVGGSRTRTLTEILADAANVNDYLNTGDTTYDGAIARALTAKGIAALIGPPALGGTHYQIAAPAELTASGQGIIGEGSGIARLLCTTANVPVVVMHAGLESMVLRGLTLSHSGTATAGGDGLQTLGIIDTTDFEDVRATANWYGFNLGNAPYATLRRCLADYNKAVGYRMHSSSANPLQYYFQQCIAASNDGDGFLYEATAAGPGGGAGISVGELNDCFTFNNHGSGVAARGRNDLPIYSIRVTGGFYGQDSSHEFYIDAYGNNHLIQPGFVELAGQSLSWANDTTACGIVLTGNDIIGAGGLGIYGNAGSLVGPGRVNGALVDGIRISSRQALVTSHINTNNGGAALHLTGANASLTAAPCVMFGNAIGFQSDQDAFMLSTTDFRPNTTPFSVSVPIVNSQIVGCLPASINQTTFGDVTTETLHVHAAAAFTGTGATKGVTILDGGLALTAGVAANGIVADNMQARVSLGVGFAAPGTVGTLLAANAGFTGTMSANLVAANTITSTTDIIANGTAHFNGAVAFTAGGVNITAGGLAVAGGIGVDNIAVTGSIYNPAATGGSKGPGTINLASNYYLNNVVH